MTETGMLTFLRQLDTVPEIAELIRQVERGDSPSAVTGVQPVQRACVGAAVAFAAGRPAVFVCGDEREARQLSADLSALTGESCVTLSAREWDFHPGTVASREWERRRIASLWRMASGDARVIVAAADALLQRTLPPERLLSLSVELRMDTRADLPELAQRLTLAGYTRCAEVEGPGQFALRGG
ncbi:MAG: transcription-repair coupling factor, partial [Oscillibacter sp.]|nr:transcription-repair coupling factor [Oscillibacter sp.]